MKFEEPRLYYLLKSYSKLRFSNFKKFVTRSVFGELRLTQISFNFQTSCCNVKIRGLGARLCRFCVIFKMKVIVKFQTQRVHVFLLNTNISFNKSEAESKMENPTHSFREINLVVQHV